MSHNSRHKEKPPFLGEWKYVYALVMGFLLATMLFLYWFTKYFE